MTRLGTNFARGTLGRDALASLLYSGGVRAGTVGLSVVAARLLGTTGAGALGVALQLVALASLVATFSLPYGLTQRLSAQDDPVVRRQLLRTSALLVGGLSLVTAAILMFGARWIARSWYADDSLAPVLFACGPLTLAAAAYQWAEGAMQGLRRFGLLARWGLALATVELVAGFLAAAWGVAAMLAARTVLRLGATALAAWHWLRLPRAASGGSGAPTMDAARSLLRFATPTLAGSAVVFAGNTVLRMLLVRGSDLAAAGHFQAADSLAQGVTLIPSAASAAFMPAAAAFRGGSDSELAPSFRRALEKVTGTNIALALAAMGLAPWVVEVVFGRDFAPAREAFVLLVVAYGTVSIGALFVAWLMGRGRPWTLFVLNSFWALVLLSAFGSGLAHWGASGAAWASVVAYGSALVGYTLVLAPRYGLPASSHVPATLVAIGALAAGAALQLLPQVPLALAVTGDLVLAVAVFAWWGAPNLLVSRPASGD